MRKITISGRAACIAPVAALAMLPGLCRGDVGVNLRMEHDSLLQFEPVLTFLSLVNDSDRELVIDPEHPESTNLKIDYVVQTAAGEPVSRKNSHPIVESIRLYPDERRDLMLDLARWFPLLSMDRYVARARVQTGGRAYESNAVFFEVVRGIEIKSVTRTVPGYTDLTRTYSLRYWPRNRQEYLFLTVNSEAEELNYGVFQLGTLVRFFQPVIEVDRFGDVQVVHQSGSDRYTRSLLKSTRRGVRFVDQTYHHEDGRIYGSRPEPPPGVAVPGAGDPEEG